MADRVTEHRVAVIAELRQFREAMSTLPGIGNQEARDMVRGIQRSLKLAEQSAKKTADNMAADFKDGFEKTSLFAKELAAQFVPALEPLADVVEGIGSNFGDLVEQLGPVGIGVGTVAIAFVGATAAAAGAVKVIYELSDAALEARDRLKEAGEAGLLPDSTVASLNEYDQSWVDLQVSLDKTSAILGGDIADDLAIANKLLADGIDWLVSQDEAWNVFWQTLEYGTLGPLTDVAELFQLLTASQREAARATLDEEHAQRKLAKEIEEVTKSIEDGIDARVEVDKRAYERQRQEAQRHYERERAEAARFYADIVALAQEQDREILAFRQGIAEAAQQINEDEFDAYLATLRLTNDARNAAAEEAQQVALELRDVWVDVAGNILDAAQTIADAVVASALEQAAALDELAAAERELADGSATIHAQRAAELEARVEQLRSGTDEEVAAYAEQAAALAALAQQERDLAEIAGTTHTTRAALLDQENEQARARASLAYGLSKSFAASQAIVQSAIAGAGVAAQLAPFLGPGAIGAGLAAGGSLLAATLASIATAQPPEFPTGRSPDHETVRVQRGEPIVSRRGRALAEEEGIDFDALSRGERPRRSSGGSARITIDPRLRRLRVVSDRLPGKRTRRGR